MPREQALDLVMVEYGRASGARRQCDPAEAAARASELSDDYLDRAKLERHAVPSATRHLLLLMAEGLHLYPEELDSIAAYVHNRQDHLQGEYAWRSPAEHSDSVYARVDLRNNGSWVVCVCVYTVCSVVSFVRVCIWKLP